MSDGGSGDGADPTADESPTRAPLSDLAERVADRRERGDAGSFEGQFAEPSFETPTSAWHDVDGSGEGGEVLAEGEETYVVDKGTFCEGCEHLSVPPEVRCTHPGTTIHEFVDKEHVRVSSCPVVAERGVPEDR